MSLNILPSKVGTEGNLNFIWWWWSWWSCGGDRGECGAGDRCDRGGGDHGDRDGGDRGGGGRRGGSFDTKK